jgi:RNA polymerase primary sigma factor
MQDSRINAALNEDGRPSPPGRSANISAARRDRRAGQRLHLHNNRIEALIDQLYGINRRIMSLDRPAW